MTARNDTTQRTPDKRTLYRTARATIACAHIKAGEYVGLRYTYTSASGTDWYSIHATQRGDLPSPVSYPAHHLTDFCL